MGNITSRYSKNIWVNKSSVLLKKNNLKRKFNLKVKNGSVTDMNKILCKKDKNN